MNGSSPLRSWGGYPPYPQIPHPVDWPDRLDAELEELRRKHAVTLAFGNGRSYGDCCMAASDHVLHVRGLDRFISADWQTGILTAQAGVTLGEILAVAIPRGWFLAVTPGTKYVTLGGAVANDVHGKNHRTRGTFGSHVERIGLLRSDNGRLACSPREHPELFAATVGGLGLTGIIEWAQIRLMSIRASQLDCTVQRFDTLDQYLALSSQCDSAHEFGVAWLDCAATGGRLGRGVHRAASFAPHGVLRVAAPSPLTVPATPPFPLVSRLSTRVLNALHWHRNRCLPVSQRVGYDAFFYPLDRVANWNRVYGCNGFRQYQCVVPSADAGAPLRALLAEVAASETAASLAVLKRFGEHVSPGLMSFPTDGITLALDFPNTPALDAGLFERLDAIVRAAAGRTYPAKDTHMRGEDFRRSYPAWERVEALRDPALCSRFWRRVTS